MSPLSGLRTEKYEHRGRDELKCLIKDGDDISYQSLKIFLHQTDSNSTTERGKIQILRNRNCQFLMMSFDDGESNEVN